MNLVILRIAQIWRIKTTHFSTQVSYKHDKQSCYINYSMVVLTLGYKTCLLSVIALIYCLILENFTHPPTNSVSVNLIQSPPRSPPIAGNGAISACGDTTRRESNMWEDSEFVYISVRSISDRVRWGNFLSLDDWIYNPPCRRSEHHIFLHSSNKNDRACRNPRSNNTCEVRLLKWDLCLPSLVLPVSVSTG